MGVQEFGGFTRESGDSPAALEVGKYATLKLNCARKHAETPCAPLISAKVLEAYEPGALARLALRMGPCRS